MQPLARSMRDPGRTAGDVGHAMSMSSSSTTGVTSSLRRDETRYRTGHPMHPVLRPAWNIRPVYEPGRRPRLRDRSIPVRREQSWTPQLRGMASKVDASLPFMPSLCRGLLRGLSGADRDPEVARPAAPTGRREEEGETASPPEKIFAAAGWMMADPRHLRVAQKARLDGEPGAPGGIISRPALASVEAVLTPAICRCRRARSGTVAARTRGDVSASSRKVILASGPARTSGGTRSTRLHPTPRPHQVPDPGARPEYGRSTPRLTSTVRRAGRGLSGRGRGGHHEGRRRRSPTRAGPPLATSGWCRSAFREISQVDGFSAEGPGHGRPATSARRADATGKRVVTTAAAGSPRDRDDRPRSRNSLKPEAHPRPGRAHLRRACRPGRPGRPRSGGASRLVTNRCGRPLTWISGPSATSDIS